MAENTAAPAPAATPAPAPTQERGRGGPRGYRPRRQDNPRDEGGFKETVVAINRVAKVVKGGKRFSFSAIVVVGDGAGTVGYGLGKAKEVQSSIQKGNAQARKNLLKFPLVGDTIPHEVMAKFRAGKVWMKPAAPGTGVIAGGGVRAVLEAGGVKNVLTKSLGSANAFNVVGATLECLKTLRTSEEIAKLRGK
ncbi:MAG: 30S ribosomal protein S5 [Elusimicrobia bacterium]|nr:30S ribosomal protein S5 [Elusimicrobiota bacterium]